ncbi:HAMP domain-containing sensor histidine kinase [Paenibacillus sp. LHD-117]|uniref:sensor histidine kinase n=1 Tax=Paenibacillus sp. LHD-117 TaxID=3071412 RepID=UPI0027E0D536|nr:HAMP domain-containing sensor histidine kinase [Paenibacillus sp. LHD-117]MDQ6419486.1 HAMP domain-containing sensor histidine kinase [Paenibacillus sp. LHD-117]
MDTKWKNKTVIVVYSLLMVIGLSGPVTLINQGDRYQHRDYYESAEFRYQLDQFASFLNLFELNAFSREKAKSSIKVNENEIANYRYQSGSLTDQMNAIREEYEPLIQEAIAGGSGETADSYRAIRDRKIDDLAKLWQDDERIAERIREQKADWIDVYFSQREVYRSDFVSLRNQFDYYFYNADTGDIHTDINLRDEQAARDVLNSGNYAFATNYTIAGSGSPFVYIEGYELLADAYVPYQGWLAVTKSSQLQAAAERYMLEQRVLYAYALAGGILFAACVIRFKRWMPLVANSSGWATYARKLPIDAKLLFLLGTAGLTVSMLDLLAGTYSALFDWPLAYIGKVVVSVIIAAFGLAATLAQGKLLVREWRSWNDVREEWSRSMSSRAAARMRACCLRTLGQLQASFLYKSAGSRLLLSVIAFTGFGFTGGWAVFASDYYGDAFYLVFALIAALMAVAVFLLLTRQLGYLNRITRTAEELAAGRTPDAVPRSGSGVLAELAGHFNALRQGVRTLQNEQTRSERLKTELITNVSHDLRTPLTSIITYAGLLKSEEATLEERVAYVEIIDQKSKRLKTMIDDLFEVSTMTSGNAKLQLERTDLVQLMQQALAEHKEAMDGSDIQFRISLPEGPVFAVADGQKLWRVFDNLIGNMLKYSLAQSRAYIVFSLSERCEAVMVFKNVSKYEINEHADELFERFKRGDTSRHTEGSGLGLAIAKSIVDLHEGRLTLETDGDLFKATVILQTDHLQKRMNAS